MSRATSSGSTHGRLVDQPVASRRAEDAIARRRVASAARDLRSRSRVRGGADRASRARCARPTFITRAKDEPGLRSARACASRARTRAWCATASPRRMWESVNELWLRSEERLARPLAPDYYRRCAPRWRASTPHRQHHDARRGVRLLSARLLPRAADMTCRILDVKYSPAAARSRWSARRSTLPVGALLKSDVRLRGVSPQVSVAAARYVAEFVILDSDFPRSLRFAVDRVAAGAGVGRVGGGRRSAAVAAA